MSVADVSDGLRVYRNGGRDKTREEGRCRMCLRHWSQRPATRHHVVPKVWFSMRGIGTTLRDCDANIVPLCRLCHDDVEEDMQSRRMLRKLLGHSEAAFAIQVRGQTWFDRYYPPTRGAT